MNILILGNGSLSIAQQERKIAVEIAKKGHKVFLICNKPDMSYCGELPAHKDMEIIEMPYSQYRFDYLNIEDKIDICLGMDQSVSPFVAEYKKKMKVKGFCIFLDFPLHTIDGTDKFNYNFDYSQRFYYWLNCALDLDSTIWISYVSGEEWKKRYHRDYEVVNYAVSNDNVFEELRKEKKTNDYIFGCQRLVPYKGNELMIEALRKLPYKYKHAYVSGSKETTEKYMHQVKSFGDRIELYNKVSEKEKMYLYYHARMTVYPQITPWVSGLSIIEGFSVKTPGVCYDYPILREIYEDAVLYAKPRSIADLRKKIQMLYEENGLREELAARGHAIFKRDFTRERMANNLLTIFSK